MTRLTVAISENSAALTKVDEMNSKANDSFFKVFSNMQKFANLMNKIDLVHFSSDSRNLKIICFVYFIQLKQWVKFYKMYLLLLHI